MKHWKRYAVQGIGSLTEYSEDYDFEDRGTR